MICFIIKLSSIVSSAAAVPGFAEIASPSFSAAVSSFAVSAALASTRVAVVVFGTLMALFSGFIQTFYLIQLSRKVEPGMVIKTDSERVKHSRKMVLEFLMNFFNYVIARFVVFDDSKKGSRNEA